MSLAALAQEINKIPPITRLFIGSAVIIAAPLFAKIYGPQAYAFNLNVIITKLQVSTACFTDRTHRNRYMQIYRLYTSFWVPWSTWPRVIVDDYVLTRAGRTRRPTKMAL
jgi:hypothetical protein